MSIILICDIDAPLTERGSSALRALVKPGAVVSAMAGLVDDEHSRRLRIVRLIVDGCDHWFHPDEAELFADLLERYACSREGSQRIALTLETAAHELRCRATAARGVSVLIH